MLHVSCWQFYCQSAETAPDFHQPNDWRIQYKVALLLFMVHDSRCPVYLSDYPFNQSAATQYVNVFILPAA